MRVPGFLWTAILALIPLLIEWLGGDYFTGQQWVPWVVIALGFVAASESEIAGTLGHLLATVLPGYVFTTAWVSLVVIAVALLLP